MSQQPSGWYDDPSNPDLLRYWDGVTWTNHTTPKKSPTLSQNTGGLPQQQAPAGAPTPTTPMPQGSGWQSQTPGQYQQAPQYAPAPGSATWMHNIKTTADGVPLSSWGRRFAARILDGIIAWIITAIVGWKWISDFAGWYGDFIQKAIDTGVTPDATTLQRDIVGYILPIVIVSLIVSVAYETIFLVWKGATPGKMALGISVRRTGAPGPLSVVAALKRQSLVILSSVTSLIPAVGSAVSILMLVNYLFPLWDDKRQALHDKIADTQVVIGKQPAKQG